MNISKELKKISKSLSGNKEVAVFYYPDCLQPWRVDAGNPSNYVSLGEVTGDFSVEGRSLQEAVEEMKKKICRG